MMYGSPANSKDLNLRIPAASIKHGKEESDLGQNQQQQQMSSGLLRYRSAPSSLLGEMCESFFPPRSSTGEAETMFARFVSPDLRDQIGEKSSPHRSIRFLPEIEREVGEASHQQNGGFPSSAPHVAAYHASSSPVTVEGSYRVATSTAMESERESGGARRSAPIRQSSSPASLFSLLSAENGKTLVPHFSYPPPTFIPAAIPAMNCIDLCRFLCVERNRRVQVRKLFQRRSQSVQQPDEMPDKLLLEAVVVLEFDVADLRDRGRGHGRKQPRRRRPLLHPRAARRCLGRSLRRLLHRHEEIQRSVGSSDWGSRERPHPDPGSPFQPAEDLLGDGRRPPIPGRHPLQDPRQARLRHSPSEHRREDSEDADQRADQEVAGARPQHGQANEHRRHAGLRRGIHQRARGAGQDPLREQDQLHLLLQQGEAIAQTTQLLHWGVRRRRRREEDRRGPLIHLHELLVPAIGESDQPGQSFHQFNSPPSFFCKHDTFIYSTTLPQVLHDPI